MSQNYLNPTCFEIEDQNIRIVAAKTEIDHNQVTKLIYGYLMGEAFAKHNYCHHPHMIRNAFRQSNIENRYSLSERQSVQTVVVDMNAQYSRFIHRLFPKAEIIIDFFHIPQLAGRALDTARI